MIYLDSFEEKIEQYKRELIKYAKEHPNGYMKPDSVSITLSDDSEEKEKAYNTAYISNRPMPDEYDGNDNSGVLQNSTEELYPDRTTPRSDNYKSYADFKADNLKSGKLRIQAFAANQAFPIQNAKVTVSKNFPDENHIFSEMYTDIDGVADNITLPTKDKSLSLVSGNEIPFSFYTVTVTHPRFLTQIYENVPIFDSIESMQPVIMLPLNNTPTTQITTENEPIL